MELQFVDDSKDFLLEGTAVSSSLTKCKFKFLFKFMYKFLTLKNSGYGMKISFNLIRINIYDTAFGKSAGLTVFFTG